MAIDFLRQEGIVRGDQLDFPITLIGAGGIGSPTALALTKMGVNQLRVWDHDNIEEHNFPNQLYRTNQLGNQKVRALDSVVKEFTGVDIWEYPRKFRLNKDVGRVVIVAVDSMKARTSIWNQLKKSPRIDLIIDGRMGGEQGLIITAQAQDDLSRQNYEQSLYTDENAEEAPCTERAIIYNVFAMAANIAKIVQMYATKQQYPKSMAFSMKNFNTMVEM